MQSVSDECRLRLVNRATQRLSLVGMDDFNEGKDSHWSTECSPAIDFPNKAPAKFRAIVYHGIFLLKKRRNQTWLRPRRTDWKCWRRGNGLIPWTMCWLKAVRNALGACCSSCHCPASA